MLRPGARARVAALRVAGRCGARGGLPRACSVHGGPVQHQLPVPQLAGPRAVALRRVGDYQPPSLPVVHREGPVVKQGRGPVFGPRQQQVRGCAAWRGQGDLKVTARRKLVADPGLVTLEAVLSQPSVMRVRLVCCPAPSSAPAAFSLVSQIVCSGTRLQLAARRTSCPASSSP